jgi:hypothetical protein
MKREILIFSRAQKFGFGLVIYRTVFLQMTFNVSEQNTASIFRVKMVHIKT